MAGELKPEQRAEVDKFNKRKENAAAIVPKDFQNMEMQKSQTPRSIQAVQALQAERKLTYNVNKRAAPTANLAFMAATDADIDLEEIDKVHTESMVSSTMRARKPDGRYVEATVSVTKQDFINLLAWETVRDQEVLGNDILDKSDPLYIALPNGFPKLKSDAMISTRVSDEMGSRLIKELAIVEIYVRAIRQWIFQQRQCQTKAKRNAIVQLLTTSGEPLQTMEPEELQDESMEMEIVESQKKK